MLRPYQKEAIDAINRRIRDGRRRMLIVLPTGTGKTVIAACLPSMVNWPFNRRMLFLVHLDELVWQAERKFREINPNLAICVEKAENYASLMCDVVIASVQTLIRRTERWPADHFGICYVDEAHHAVGGNSYLRILNHFGFLDRDDRLVIGLTATPRRADNIGLEKIFQVVAYSRTIEEMIEQGWLAPVHAVSVSTTVDLSRVRTLRGDFIESELDSTVNTPERNRIVAEKYLELAKGQSALAFTVTIRHSEALARTLKDHGIPAHAVSGETPEKERRRVIDAFRAGEIKVLASAGVFNEGFDAPNASVALMARPTQSSLLYQQQIGRVLRPWPAPEIGPNTKKAMIIDFVDNTSVHPLITVASLFGLDPKFNLKGKSVLHVTRTIRELVERYRTPVFYQAESLEHAMSMVSSVSVLRPPVVPELARRYSQYPWLASADDSMVLSMASHGMIIIRQDAIGNYQIWLSRAGLRAIVAEADNPREAFRQAHRFIPEKVKRMLRLSAAWRTMEPTAKQARMLWCIDTEIKRSFRTPDDLYRWLITEYEKGNMWATRGGVSLKIEEALSRQGR